MSNEKPTDRLKRGQDSLETYCTVYWIALFVNAALLCVYLYLALTPSNFTFTYFLPAGHPGSLTSQRWTADFFATGSTVALLFLLLSGAWVVAHPMGKRGLAVHLVLLLILFIYYTVVVAFIWSFPLAKSNVPSGDNAGNPSNDPRWCCVNFNLPGSSCPNSPNPSAIPPLPGYQCYTLGNMPAAIGQADLIVNWVYLFKFCGLIIALVFMLIDGVYMVLVLRPAVRECSEALKATLPPQDQQDDNGGGGGGALSRALRLSSLKEGSNRNHSRSRSRNTALVAV